jgi:hypothetical protein
MRVAAGCPFGKMLFLAKWARCFNLESVLLTPCVVGSEVDVALS